MVFSVCYVYVDERFFLKVFKNKCFRLYRMGMGVSGI